MVTARMESMGVDVVIVGAGSAGSVLAARLSEDTSCRVALLEAGGMPDDPDIADPLKWPMLQGRNYGWAYVTEPASHVHGDAGPLDVHFLPDAEVSPLVRAYMEAARSCGVSERGEHNGREITGVAANSLTVRGGRRLSVADALRLSQTGTHSAPA